MLGRNHAVTTAAAWAWAAPILLPGVTVPELAATTVLAAGMGVLPDIDHPDAAASQQFGVLSQVVSKVASGAAGGHRQGTHSLAAPALIAAGLWAGHRFGWDGIRWVEAALVGMAATVGLSLLGPSIRLRTHPIVAFGAGAAAVWWTLAGGVAAWQYEWVTALVVFGFVSHMIGDGLTPQGVPLLWPISRFRFRLPLFRTGSPLETLVGVAASMATVWAFLSVTVL